MPSTHVSASAAQLKKHSTRHDSGCLRSVCCAGRDKHVAACTGEVLRIIGLRKLYEPSLEAG